MKIAIFSDNFYPELSGISDSIIAIAKEYAKEGHEVRFYAPWHPKRNYLKSGHKPREIDLGPNIKVHRLPSIPMPAPTGQGRFVIPLGFSKRSLRKWRPDIIHTHHFGGAGLEAIMASKSLNVPLIGTSHTPFREFMQYSPINSEWAVNKVLKYVSWYYNKCVFVTAPSRFLFKEMIEYGFKRPHDVISNPIDPEEFKPVDSQRKTELKERFGFNSPTIIYTGRLAPEKHIDVVIRSFAIVKKEIPEATLGIIGHGVSHKSLAKLAQELGVSNDVKFLGFVGQETFVEAYQASDIFAVASTAEMQCLSMMNAMLAGLPVVGVNAKALPEYINDKNGFVVDINDHQAMAEKILYLIKNEGEIKRLGGQAREYATQFSGPNIAKEWISIYQKAIADSSVR